MSIVISGQYIMQHTTVELHRHHWTQ